MSHWNLDEVRQHVGRQAVYRAPEPIGRAAARYFAVVIGARNAVYADPAAARAAGHRDVVVPPTWLCETNQYVADLATDADGFRGHRWRLPVTGCRVVRGGNRYVFHRHAYPDDVVTVTWTITAVDERIRRDATRMLVVGSSATYVGMGGDLIVENHETLVYQPLREAS